MVRLESPAFVPGGQKPAPSNQAQEAAATSNPEENDKPADQQ